MKPVAVIELVTKEIKRAEGLHPGWPDDPIHGAAIVAEEAGELVQAAIDRVYSHGGVAHMIEEAVQVAASAIRLLLYCDHDAVVDEIHRQAGLLRTEEGQANKLVAIKNPCIDCSTSCVRTDLCDLAQRWSRIQLQGRVA